ncbi:MAG: crossover junction endodeoxyribonuclease RuvC, partial [Sphaerochaetaceae bacterium]
MRILGIDPGYAQTGWGVVESDGQHNRPVSFGIIKTSASQPDSQRIHFIAKSVGELAQEHKVEICAMEDIFFT